MPTPLQKQGAASRNDGRSTTAFNYGKLQAVACMGASALVSITLIIWAIKSFL